LSGIRITIEVEKTNQFQQFNDCTPFHRLRNLTRDSEVAITTAAN